MRESTRSIVVVTLAGYLLAGSLLILFHSSPTAQFPAFLFLWIWPAIGWFVFLDGPAVERFLLASGLSLLLVVLAVLVAGYLPGDLNTLYTAAGVALVVLIPLGLTWRRGTIAPLDIQGSRKHWLALGLIVLLALFLRLTNLGYKEFQGDEGVIMVRAASMLTGDEGEIFLHQKGPVEILIPASVWSLTGTINDYWSRLPFTWVGILEVVAIYWLARLWFGRKAGIFAALLFAIGGFGIAFSRIVQYQNLVMLWGTLALISATKYREDGRQRHIVLSSVFVGAGLLAHYDAILVLPAALWVLAQRPYKNKQLNIKSLLLTLFLGALVVGIFYIPFALSPNASRTLDYLLADRVTVSEETSLFGWSGSAVWQMMTFYNSIWYALGVLIFGIYGMIRSLLQRKEVAATLYLLVPAFFYLFVVGDPRTHVYTIIPGAVILAGYAVSEIRSAIARKESRPLEIASIVAASIWLVVVVLYPILIFVDISKERQRTWAENRPIPALYPVTWDEPPRYGLFGFPHQAGWRAALDRVPEASYPYSSNEEAEITNWYMSQNPRTNCGDAETVMIARNAQDEVSLDAARFDDFSIQEVIEVRGEPGIEILRRDSADEIRKIDVSRYDRWLTPEEAAPSEYAGAYPINISLEDKVKLLGYDLDVSEAWLGGKITVTLYWEALQPFDRNKQVFVHLYDGNLWAQHDGAPECAINPTTRWEPGQRIVDPHILDLPEEMSVNRVPLIVGMYDLVSKERMVVNGSGENYFQLTDVVIGREGP